MKKKTKLILQTMPVIVFIVLVGTCESLPGVVSEPAISFDSVSLTGLDFNGIDMIALVRVKNDNAFSIPFPQIN